MFIDHIMALNCSNEVIGSFLDSQSIQMVPLTWNQDNVSIMEETGILIPSTSTPLLLAQLQRPSSHLNEEEIPKEKEPSSLRILIDEVEMLVQQVEENVGLEKVQKFIETSEIITADVNLVKDESNLTQVSSHVKRASARKENVRRRAKKFDVDKEQWKRNSNKQKRMLGIAYESASKSVNKGEQLIKGARHLRPSCNCSLSQKSSRMQCNQLTEKDRQNLFDRFWKKMNWGEKKVFVGTLVEAVPVKQRKSKQANSRRDKSMIFHLMKGKSRIRVCKIMFINTLDVGEWSVRNWVENSTKLPPLSISKRPVEPTQNRQHIINFLKLLPTTKTSNSSKKLFLEANWQSINEVYREYVKHCTINGFEHLSHTSFRNEFTRLNYSLHKPKNESTTSSANKVKPILEEVYANFQVVNKDNNWSVVQDSNLQTAVPTVNTKKMTAKRAKKFEVDEMAWRRNSNKRKRMSGAAYESLKKKDGKYEYVPKDARKMGPHCNCALSKRSSKMMCNELTESDRVAIFDNFWKSMTWGQKKVYVSTLIEVVPVKQHRATNPESSRRDKSLIFHLKRNNKLMRVCKVMFTNTLAIGEWSVHSWVTNSGESEPSPPKAQNTVQSENRKHIIEFLKLLPTLESHWSSSSAAKRYLEPNWQSINEVYRAYIKHCVDNGYTHLSHTSFRDEFAKLNYSLHKPK